tara:strand:+ start:1130 stop:1972 length:843 start_codon:yes stop_codon:yes gene_type:complete
MRLFEEEELEKIDSLSKVEPGKKVTINGIPFLGTAVFNPAIIEFKGKIKNPLYSGTSDSVRHYYYRENPKRKSKDVLKINLRTFFDKYPELFTDENLDLPLGKFIAKLKQEGNDDYKLLVHSSGDEEEYISFKIKDLPEGRGLYMWVIDDIPQYIGIASSKSGLKGRINNEYGSITAYKCTIDGHTQTCRSNISIRDDFNAKKNISLYVLPIDTEKYKNDPEFIKYMDDNFNFKGTAIDKNILEVFEKFLIKTGSFPKNRRLEESFINRFQELAGIKSIP